MVRRVNNYKSNDMLSATNLMHNESTNNNVTGCYGDDASIIDALEYAFTTPSSMDGVNRCLSAEDDGLVLKNEDVQMKILTKPNGLTVVVDSPNNRMRVALSVLIRLVLPLIHGVARGWNGIRGIRVFNTLTRLKGSRNLLATLFAFAANTISMSLSTVQVAHKIDPLLRVIKSRRYSWSTPAIEAKTSKVVKVSEQPEKCVNCVVLAEPLPGVPIRADIILIHGLHGSLVNTWKQGLWNSEGRLVNFERPPKPPIRPPKRPRHSRTSLLSPPHESKKAKITKECHDLNEEQRYQTTTSYKYSNKTYSYECGEVENIKMCDDMEYSYPTFRLRIEDDGNKAEVLSANKMNQQSQKKTKNKTDENWSACWPGDWLPLDCPGVRVLSINYTTDPYLWRPVWITKRNRSSLAERAREMTELLIEKGVGQDRPIVWVGHSKGGLYIKQMIVDAWESGRPAAAPLWRSARGAFFYSVPHRGSLLADFNLPLLRQSVELMEIQKNCSSIVELHRRFVALYRGGHLKIDVFSFVETAMTLMSVLYLRIVGIDSADPGIGEVCGVHLDHREICKPRGRQCILYTELVEMINRVS